LAGINPQLPVQDKKPFENICPQCAHTKALARPASSSRFTAGTRGLDFKIKKGNPAVLKQRRQVFEMEQQDFI